MNNEADPLVDRVLRTLEKLGYRNVRVQHIGGGTIKLSGHVVTAEDRAVVVAAVNTVAGVNSITLAFSKP